MADNLVFPQDWGTGLDEQVDWNDAGAFAHHSDHPNLRNYVIDGFEFTPDYANDLLGITEGKAVMWETTTETNDHRDDDGPDAKVLEGASFSVQRGVSGDLTLIADATNYVYLGVNQQNNDETEYYINSTATPPQEPYLLLGTVDTSANVALELNRAPQTTTKRLHVTGASHGQHYD